MISLRGITDRGTTTAAHFSKAHLRSPAGSRDHKRPRRILRARISLHLLTTLYIAENKLRPILSGQVINFTVTPTFSNNSVPGTNARHNVYFLAEPGLTRHLQPARTRYRGLSSERVAFNGRNDTFKQRGWETDE